VGAVTVLRTADHLPKPTPTDDDQLFRLTHHDVLTCCLPPELSRWKLNPYWETGLTWCGIPVSKKTYLDYVRISNMDRWTKSVRDFGDGSLAAGCRHVMATSGADGILVDTPFETVGGVHDCVDIANEISPGIMCPNVGSFDKFAARGATPAGSLMFLSRWVFVQVLADTSKVTLEQWRNVIKPEVERRLREGKTIIAGIYDPDGHNPELAALLTTTIEHKNLYFHYATAKPPEIGDAKSQWNPWWGVWR